MCVTCVDVETEPPPAATWSRARVAEVAEKVQLEALERNRLRPEPWPICNACNRVVDPAECHEMYKDRCLCCGISRLEKLFFRLWKARGRQKRKAALKRIARYAKTGR